VLEAHREAFNITSLTRVLRSKAIEESSALPSNSNSQQLYQPTSETGGDRHISILSLKTRYGRHLQLEGELLSRSVELT